MNRLKIMVGAASLMLLPLATTANDFSTATRVQFVMECMQLNQGKMNVYEGVHKCSCVVDKLAEVFTEKDFEDANTGFRYQNLPGERGAMFKDDADVTDGIGLFKKTHAEAYESCRIRR
jgi:hypothetical protein